MTDGFGLCSPMRWHPSDRGASLTSCQKSFCVNLARTVDAFVALYFPDPRKAVITLALGKMLEPPFTPEDLQGLRVKWFSLLPNPAEASIPQQFEEEEALGMMFPTTLSKFYVMPHCFVYVRARRIALYTLWLLQHWLLSRARLN